MPANLGNERLACHDRRPHIRARMLPPMATRTQGHKGLSGAARENGNTTGRGRSRVARDHCQGISSHNLCGMKKIVAVAASKPPPMTRRARAPFSERAATLSTFRRSDVQRSAGGSGRHWFRQDDLLRYRKFISTAAIRHLARSMHKLPRVRRTGLPSVFAKSFPERWPSGRRRGFAKPVNGQPFRRFESCPLR